MAPGNSTRKQAVVCWKLFLGKTRLVAVMVDICRMLPAFGCIHILYYEETGKRDKIDLIIYNLFLTEGTEDSISLCPLCKHFEHFVRNQTQTHTPDHHVSLGT
jgi:hypothetical protein